MARFPKTKLAFFAYGLFLSVGVTPVFAIPKPATLYKIETDVFKDSVAVFLDFGFDLPESYKVGYYTDTLGNLSLILAFKGAGISDSVRTAKLPKWILAQESYDENSQISRIHVFVQKEVPYRVHWEGQRFHLLFPNELDNENSIWKNPWLYAGLGAATALGTAVIWLTSDAPRESNPTQNPSNEIPAPDIQLP